MGSAVHSKTPKMMKLLVLTLLIAATTTVNAQTGIDIGSIIAGLNAKAIGMLKSVAIPALNNEVSRIGAHIDGLIAFFKDKEGDIAIPNTPFSVHFKAERCHLFGKRLLIVDFQKCKAKATEAQTGLSSTCEKGSQKEAIECATEKVLNLVKIVSIALKNGNAPAPPL